MAAAAPRRSSSCALCEGSNLASFCSACTNLRLSQYYARMRLMKTRRDLLYSRIAGRLEAKEKADEQKNWRESKDQNIKKLRNKLNSLKMCISQEKAKAEEVSSDLKSRNALLYLAHATLKKKQADLSGLYTNFIRTQEMALLAITSDRLKRQSKAIKQICKLFPVRRVNSDGEKKDGYSGPYDLICNARLPRGLDPHSVPSGELGASLGYMIRLLNILDPILAAPSLHCPGFGGSCSRVWQRGSYWSSRPSQNKVYPLFIPRQNCCSSGEENSWSERGSSNFGVDSMSSEKKAFLDTERSSSFNYSSASPHSMETHKDLQKGISLLKKSVACITAYCYNSMGLDVPSDLSTFEAFGSLLSTMSSSKSLRSAYESRVPPRSDKQTQYLNRSIWKANSGISSKSCLMDSVQTTIMPSSLDNLLLNSTASFLYPGPSVKLAKQGKSDSLLEGWDMVEHDVLPPPPSQVEDIEHWIRAMFTDAKKK